ncbi:hypothetical protein AO073_05870 [Pseudomonas syringae ICMP 11293]|uniref:hypothetical protein n=1 Tax=Pseudomonas syringae TaxID=317 RepID=UPI0007310C4B|nr:hypothetical protein [Pseudomonas syringae]KTB90867.1 hypothetical protein AO073_05870 [Pseudomonas syringae ICMP 11293]
MDGLTPSVWFPVVTLIAGIALKAIFDSLSDGRKAAIERTVREENRKESMLMQRIESQRILLPDLQEAISEMMRSVGLVNLADIQHARSSGNWGKGLVDPELSEASRIAFRTVTLYKVRIHDEKLRKSVSDLSSTCTLVTLAGSEKESNKLLDDASFKYEEVNTLIGSALRALYVSESAVP